jgi:hypothetical protein
MLMTCHTTSVTLGLGLAVREPGSLVEEDNEAGAISIRPEHNPRVCPPEGLLPHPLQDLPACCEASGWKGTSLQALSRCHIYLVSTSHACMYLPMYLQGVVGLFLRTAAVCLGICFAVAVVEGLKHNAASMMKPWDGVSDVYREALGKTNEAA